MPELLRIQTADFELSIWCNDVSKRQATYQATLAKRQAISHHSAGQPMIRFSPPLAITEATFMDQPIEIKGIVTHSGLVEALELGDFIFFENIQYHFEWIFLNNKRLNETGVDESNQAIGSQATDSINNISDVEQAYLTHRSHLINENFRFSQSRSRMPAHLTGTINTANDVGWLRLPLNYVKSNQTYKSNIAFEVLPTKMSLHDDLPAMYQAIDTVFPLWRFSLVEKTEQNSAQTKQRHQFPLLWLANFSHLRNQLTHALKVINQAPHSRLQAHTSYNKATRLKGKIPARLGAKIKEDFANGLHEQRYQVTKKQLSVDTLENRFIKMVVSTAKKRLADFEYKLRQSNAAPDKQRLSDTFLDELHQWQQPLQKTLKQSFMTDVGDYNGRNRESLVLQQKVGYSSVYRIWQELKLYLDVFDNQSSISMKSVAEIYEVWCFLTLRNILIDELGFKELSANKQTLKLKDFFEYQLQDGFAGAFEFERNDGVKARLAHEPPFNKTTKDIRTYSVSQKPDIVLEVILPNNKRFIWLFDAKYRIKTLKSRYDDPEQNIDTMDFVPDDAINQMHRYRDALIRIERDKNALNEEITNKETARTQKSRPIFGAFALYPGYFDQVNTNNPYLNSIDEVSIGAFSLLPSPLQPDSKISNGHYWLLDFLRQQIGTGISPQPNNTQSTTIELTNNKLRNNEVNSKAVAYQANNYQVDKVTKHNHQLEEHLYLQEAARIPYSGMEQILYPDLTLTISLAPKAGRHKEYIDGFEHSTAQWYHLPQTTFLDKYKQHIVNEIRYLAIATTNDAQPTSKQISKLWPIKSVILVPRSVITAEQSGKSTNDTKLYYLFKLGKPLTIRDKIDNVPLRDFKNSMKLTTLEHLQQAANFSGLQTVYQQALI
ncbi:DUF2357 domain-containing protein [Psychrobacter sp. SZ93C1]|uniref:DUF2357 domain-containing protein n=1 Tax=Psychrobacter sp. SZ93C1 TaxID=2792058 RepID=UPI0018CF55D7|nr:DUF2357 domain-containing protein [Psychrobacter sp. SZ93C1]MBH0064411.1 restriction endonuclease-like protein [Psychrobacter sp. SZ93C1]